MEERRESLRFPAIFPVATPEGVLGETVNIDKKGVCLKLEKDLSHTFSLSFRIELPFASLSNLYLNLVWKDLKLFPTEGRFLCGGYFLNLDKKEEPILEEAISKYIYLEPDFLKLTHELRIFLLTFKRKCDRFDVLNKKEEKQIEFLEKNKLQLYPILNEHFKKTWEITKYIDKEKYKLHQNYYQKMLSPLLKDTVETNRIVCDKPFGYSGDYLIISYFYNFHNQYLGNSSYERLINSYTCNIPIASAVVERKDFLKELILKVVNAKEAPKILSIGSGPARELIELLEEEKITKSLYFDCLDFERRTSVYLRREIEKIESKRKKHLQLRFIYKNILELIRNNENRDLFDDYDLIYSTGVFDYLSFKIAKRMVEELYQLLNVKSNLVITNVKKEETDHRPYYEMFGGWHLHYRNKEELLSWTENIKARVRFEPISEKNSFLFLNIEKINR